MSPRALHNVRAVGPVDGTPLVLAHGLGCDQTMWHRVVDAFAVDHRVVLFDHAGAGGAHPSTFDPDRHASLEGYTDDVVALLDDLALGPVVLVGHSVSATIALLVAARRPDLVDRLVLVGPSPRYLDDDGYRGGFSAAEIDELLATLETNYLGWSDVMAPVIAGNPDRPELGAELTASFRRTDPQVTRAFARATFLSDNRADLARVRTASLVVQCREDAIAPVEVGRYVHEHLAGSRFVLIDAVGHCPQLSAPEELVAVVLDYLAGPPAP
ncbi:alpha/beta hydrolase [Isoptericola sp. S6320L]|uniref:alpha/beta fold hydrolase n=1 Tax=Isoptericola sp. S6320L TaxID=2926411 RepID=UPI001FF37AD1|nr:alpha/beta hydrolase [Isoptericola sp. S6320L]MCK0115447.1 alpha/beta hydrolase [Isoptericola sp. S6320L]